MTRREKVIEAISKYICIRFGIVLEDYDGSSNWWMFVHDTEKFIESFEQRGFKILEEQKNDSKENTQG